MRLSWCKSIQVLGRVKRVRERGNLKTDGLYQCQVPRVNLQSGLTFFFNFLLNTVMWPNPKEAETMFGYNDIPKLRVWLSIAICKSLVVHLYLLFQKFLIGPQLHIYIYSFIFINWPNQFLVKTILF